MKARNIVVVKNLDSPACSIGDEAITYSGATASTSQSLSWIMGERHYKLFLAAVASLGVPDEAQVKVCFALPFAAFDNGGLIKDFVRQYAGQHTVKGERRKSISFQMEVESQKQGSLAVLNHALPWGGKIDRTKFRNALVVDPGGYTCEILPIVDGKLNHNLADPGKGLGSKRIANKLQARLERQGITLSDAQVMDVIERGELFSRSHSTEWIQDFIVNEQTALAEEIAARCDKAAAGNLDLVEFILVTGGSGKTLAPYLAPYLHKPTISRNYLYDNAEGALKYALRGGSDNTSFYLGVDIGFYNTKAYLLDPCGELSRVCFRSVVGDRTHNEKI
jgi:hypothetical protein